MSSVWFSLFFHLSFFFKLADFYHFFPINCMFTKQISFNNYCLLFYSLCFFSWGSYGFCNSILMVNCMAFSCNYHHSSIYAIEKPSETELNGNWSMKSQHEKKTLDLVTDFNFSHDVCISQWNKSFWEWRVWIEFLSFEVQFLEHALPEQIKFRLPLFESLFKL